MAAKGSRVNTGSRYASAVTGIPLVSCTGQYCSGLLRPNGTADLGRFGVPS